MATELSKKEIKEKIDEGWVHSIVIFEMIGQPKDHVEKTLSLYMDNIRKDDNIISLKEDHEETIELDDGMFSLAIEAEYLVLGLEKLTWFAFNFMPASIEIKGPKELTFRDKDLTSWFNDLLAKLHEVNTIHTSLKGEHQELVKSLNAAVRNAILLCTDEPITSKEIGKKIGMTDKRTLLFLEAMMKEGRIKKQGSKFVKI